VFRTWEGGRDGGREGGREGGVAEWVKNIFHENRDIWVSF